MDRDFTLRDITHDDWQAFAAIRLEALRLHPEVYATLLQDAVKNTVEDWQRVINRMKPIGIFVPASEQASPKDKQQELVGMMGYLYPSEYCSESAIPVAVYVRASHRGLGCNQMMMDYIKEKIMRETPAKRIIIDHVAGNEVAGRSYVRAGYRLMGVRKNLDFRADGTKADLVLYELPLR
ncbi:MAG: GNAT family N-acetyltransferase [Alphaproteobacteria bacterium]